MVLAQRRHIDRPREKFGRTRSSSAHADPTSWTMNFHSMNDFNVLLNLLSGNFFPLTEDKRRLHLGNTIYAIFLWILNLIYLFSMMTVMLFFVPPMEGLQRGGTAVIVCVELVCLETYLNTQREHLRNLIRRINSILIKSEDSRRCIQDIVEPHSKRLKIYTVAVVTSTSIWLLLPIIKVLDNDQFTYTDYILPAYMPGAPFNSRFFVFSVIMQSITGSIILLKKVALDVYTSYLITLLAGLYLYVQERMTAALAEKNERLVIDELKECIQRHSETMAAGGMLEDILCINIGFTYLNCICLFCFLGFSLITLPAPYAVKFMTCTYGMSVTMQVYMLCWCTQELLDASTSIADGIFHANWYERGPVVNSIIRIVAVAGRLECRLTAFKIVDLTIPTFLTMMNKACSACLFLLAIQ